MTRNPWPDTSHSGGQDLASQSLPCGSFSTALAYMGSMKFVFAWVNRLSSLFSSRAAGSSLLPQC